jgi:mannosyltransferase
VWFDEAATLSAVRRPLSQLPGLVSQVDAVHGLYYLVAHGWSGLVGDSITAMRLLGALGVGVTAALVVLLTKRLATSRTAIVAGVSVVLLPGVSWAGVEARSYAWAAALAVLSTYLLVIARQRPRVGLWIAYAVALAASHWWFLLSAPMIGVHGLALILADRRLPRGWVTAAAAATMATLPLAQLAYHQRQQISHIRLSPSDVALRVLGAQTFTGSGFRSEHREWWLFAGAVLAALVTFVVASGVVRRRRLGPHDRLQLPLAWSWAVVPTVAIAGPHLWGAQLYQVRYLTYSVPAVAILVAVGLSTYRPGLRRVLSAALVLTAVPGVVGHHLPDAKSGEDYRGLAALADSWEVDAVVFSGAGSRGIKVSYPAPFRGTRDLILQRSATESDTLFGVNAPPRRLQRREVAGEVLLHYERSDQRPDRYAPRLRRLGCRPSDVVVRWRFRATLLLC